MGMELPNEIEIEILLRLPVKSLSRFRCVCRSWNSIITSQHFISLHLAHSINTQDQHQHQHPHRDDNTSSNILLLHYSLSRRRELYTVYRDRHSSFTQLQDLDFTIKSYGTYYYVASCNGLLCFSDYLINSLTILLWNPSIRKSFRVPVPRFIDTDITHTYVLGFGFDCKTNSYKVLRLIYALARNTSRQVPPEVDIFELGADRWRSIDTHAPYVIPETSQAFVDGAIHWIGYRPTVTEAGASLNFLAVVLFDVHGESFSELQIPDGIAHPHVINLSVTVHGKSLCLLQANPWIEGTRHEGMCSIWVMKQYGVKESWTKLFNVDMRGLGGLGKVLGFRKHGSILVVNGSNELVSYDPESRKVDPLGPKGILRSFQVITHMESLVLLNGTLGDEQLGKPNFSRLKR